MVAFARDISQAQSNRLYSTTFTCEDDDVVGGHFCRPMCCLVVAGLTWSNLELGVFPAAPTSAKTF